MNRGVNRGIRTLTAGCKPGLLALLFAIWAIVFVIGSYAWRYGDYYDYGWYVPPLALLIFLRRWRELPDAPTRPGKFWWLGFAAAVPAWWLARVLTVADPAWRLPQWIVAGLALAAGGWIVTRLKGRGASRSLLPVAAFALTAVPPPTVIEQSLVRHLSNGVVQLAAGIFNFCGRPVQVVGDRMASLGEWVEVADGCSGIRSLQGFLMVALFFGEWFRLQRFERLLLLGLSLGCVWLTNVARALLLAWLRFEHGPEAFSRWHDRLGLLAFAVAAAAVWWLATQLEPVQLRLKSAPPVHPLRPLALPSAWCGLVVLAAVEISVWQWMHPPQRKDLPVLEMHYPLPGMAARFDSAGYQKIQPKLRCSNGWLAAVGEDFGARRLRAGWFTWDATDSGSVLEAFQHTPEGCMGAIGWTFVAKHPPQSFAGPGGNLAFDVTEFKTANLTYPLFVYKTVWISDLRDASLQGGIAGLGSASAQRRLRLAVAAHRFRPAHARVLMGVVAGHETEAAAWRHFRSDVLTGLYLQTPSSDSPAASNPPS